MAAAKAIRRTALAALAAGAFLLLAAGDLALRSRSALLKAEQEEYWRANPAAKAAHFEAEYSGRAAQKEKAAGAQANPETAARAADLRAAEKDFRLSESSAKMAYIWYRTAAEDFNFPGNPWAARARARLPGALNAWRAELAAKGIKAEPWMLQ